MNHPQRPPDSESPPRPGSHWPWGQIGWCLTGLGFSLNGVEHLGINLGVVSPPSEDEPSIAGTLAVLLILGAIVCSIPVVMIRWGFIRRRPSIVRLTWLRRVNFGLLAFAVLSVMLALFIPAIHAARIAQQQSSALEPWHEHSFASGAIQLSSPPNWEIVQGPTSSASGVQMVDRQNDLSLTAVLVPKQDLAVQSLKELAQQSAKSLGTRARLSSPTPG